ncbi:MAG: TetR/AcrR family transcriptional regulator [Tetrasphaera sp.]
MCAAQPYDVEIGEGNRLTERVLPAVLEIIERGDFTGPVMRKVASECRMSLTALYSIVPSKNRLLLALAVHLQSQALEKVTQSVRPGDTEEDVVRRAAHASFAEFTRHPELAVAALAGDRDESMGFEVAHEEGLGSSPGMFSPFGRDTTAWKSGRMQVLTLGWAGTTFTYGKGMLTADEAHRAIDHLVDAAFLLPEN